MGYTHYWYRAPFILGDAEKFAAFIADCRKVCAALAIPLGDASGEAEPIFSADGVYFNGHINSGAMMPQVARVDGLKWPTEKAENIAGWQHTESAKAGSWFAGPLVSTRTLPDSGDGSYESFIVELRPERCFDCCKTNYHPYDLAVQCCLIALKEHFGAAAAIASDGDADAWREPADVCQHVLGYGLTFELDRGEGGRALADSLEAEWTAAKRASEQREHQTKVGNYPPPVTDRNEAIARIRKALKDRTGRSWSVTGGRGTGWGWIEIDAPPKRRQWHYELRAGATTNRPEDYEEVHNPAKPYGHMGPDDLETLRKALGLADREVGQQGVSIPAGGDYRTEYVDRAEGREPRMHGVPYWD